MSKLSRQVKWIKGPNTQHCPTRPNAKANQSNQEQVRDWRTWSQAKKSEVKWSERTWSTLTALTWSDLGFRLIVAPDGHCTAMGAFAKSWKDSRSLRKAAAAAKEAFILQWTWVGQRAEDPSTNGFKYPMSTASTLNLKPPCHRSPSLWNNSEKLNKKFNNSQV